MISAYKEVVKKLAELKGFKPEPRPLTEEVIKALDSLELPFFLVRAPTGYGKTAISYTLALHSLRDASLYDRVIHVLPMRAIVEDIDITAKEALGFSKTKMMGSSEEFMHLFPLNVTTADTFTWDILKLNTKRYSLIKAGKEFGYDYLTQASILTSIVIFDEAHFLLEDRRMKEVFLAVLRFLTKEKVPIILMTATLSNGYRELFQEYTRNSGYDFDVFELNENDPFARRELSKEFEISIETGNPLDFVERGRRNLIIVNTVRRAVQIYKNAKSLRFGNIMLIHGRMTAEHKRQLIEKLRKWKNKEEFLVIATQVVEAGVDVSADVMITDAAPINSLLQRFGRVARYEEGKGKIVVIRDADGPYDVEKVQKTISLLDKAENFHPRLPWTYQKIVGAVHGRKKVEVLKVNRAFIGTLVSKLTNPAERSIHVLKWIEARIRRGEPLLRDFLIPVEVGNDVVLVSPEFLWKLWKSGEVKVLRGNVPWIPANKNDTYELAKYVALGGPVKVVLKREYDWECGLA